MSIAPRQRVLFVLTVIASAACLVFGFVTAAPNRLVSGQPLFLWQAASAPLALVVALLGAILLAFAYALPSPRNGWAALITASALILLLCVTAGQSATALMSGAPPARRIALGPAFWIALFCAAMIVIDALQRLKATTAMRLLVTVIILLALAALLLSGTFDHLSIMREYTARRSAFADALERHLALVIASVAIALVIGVPLGLLVARRPSLRGPVFGTLNLLQTIPSIALFGLMIVPLSALAAAVPQLGRLGVGGIGATPAVIALVFYGLLPIVRNVQAGLAAIDPAVIETARGMGFTRAQIFRHVELPLAMPSLLAGLRIVLVQTIGLAAVAALIGAGGFGTFIFQGIGQYATDLVLLGAGPIIFLALAADFLLDIAALLVPGSRP